MSRSNNMPERDIERALGAQLKVDAASVRLSRDPWDAVAPEMGSQRARRPWEVIADILNAPRSPFKPQYMYTAGGALVAVLVVLLLVLFLNTDDGADGESVPAAESEQIVPPPVTLAEGLTVQAGSDEAEIFTLFERYLSSLRVRDARAFQAECHPDLRATVSVEEAAAFIEEDSTRPSYGQPVYTSAMNFVIHDIRIFRNTATVNYDWREGEALIMAADSHALEFVAGRWFLTGSTSLCAGRGVIFPIVPALPPTNAPPPPVTLDEGFIVEPGSDEAEIVTIMERGMFALRLRDFDAVHADCHPDLQASVSVADIAAYVEVDQFHPAYGQPAYTTGMNALVHSIRVFRNTATMQWDHYEGEDLIGDAVTQVFEKVDGRWYVATSQGPCAGTD